MIKNVCWGEYKPDESIVPDHAPPQPEEESIESN